VAQAVLWIDPATPLGAWTPPESIVTFPKGVTLRLPPRGRIVLEVHYRKSSTPQTDRSAVALYFARAPGRALAHRQLGCGTTVLDRSVDALALTPRLGSAGESMEVVATRPDQTVDPLCVIPRYEPGYPITYRCRAAPRYRSGRPLQIVRWTWHLSLAPISGSSLPVSNATCHSRRQRRGIAQHQGHKGHEGPARRPSVPGCIKPFSWVSWVSCFSWPRM
jgi:hypothetical protein